MRPHGISPILLLPSPSILLRLARYTPHTHTHDPRRRPQAGLGRRYRTGSCSLRSGCTVPPLTKLRVQTPTHIASQHSSPHTHTHTHTQIPRLEGTSALLPLSSRLACAPHMASRGGKRTSLSLRRPQQISRGVDGGTNPFPRAPRTLRAYRTLRSASALRLPRSLGPHEPQARSSTRLFLPTWTPASVPSHLDSHRCAYPISQARSRRCHPDPIHSRLLHPFLSTSVSCIHRIPGTTPLGHLLMLPSSSSRAPPPPTLTQEGLTSDCDLSLWPPHTQARASSATSPHAHSDDGAEEKKYTHRGIRIEARRAGRMPSPRSARG
ncbi:hypothetical protein K438DRAFT_598698 [Mycena galopus ATCC 62051]|nr:hypothetical protein K438DRAFT_598698 [Mycena galopus ATCC 62051]